MQQLYCEQRMATADNQYTSLDFLSKIRLQPKRNLFKQLSLDTDLEQINQVLSPKAKPTPLASSHSLDRQLTRRFVVQLITNYEGEQEATAKWQGFLQSIASQQTFDLFVQSLKDIKEEPKPIPNNTNPEHSSPGNQEASRQPRSSSCEKAIRKEEKKVNGAKERMREEIAGLRDLLLAGEKFLRQDVTEYS